MKTTSVNDEERKRQAKLRGRACNDSFRQAVDKSYGQNTQLEEEGRSKQLFSLEDLCRFRK